MSAVASPLHMYKAKDDWPIQSPPTGTRFRVLRLMINKGGFPTSAHRMYGHLSACAFFVAIGIGPVPSVHTDTANSSPRPAHVATLNLSSEGCIARVTDRDTQSALEVALGNYQGQMRGCTAGPVTVRPTTTTTTTLACCIHTPRHRIDASGQTWESDCGPANLDLNLLRLFVGAAWWTARKTRTSELSSLEFQFRPKATKGPL